MNGIKFVQKIVLYEPTVHYEKVYRSGYYLNYFLKYRKEVEVEDGMIILGISNKVSGERENTHEFNHIAFDFEIGDKVQLDDTSEYKIIDKSRSPYGHITYYLETKHEDVENYDELLEKRKVDIDKMVEEFETKQNLINDEPKLNFFGKTDLLIRKLFRIKN